ncbi:MAG: HAMP domain-containing sensor histidine kinase [Candidatus Margulisbacteria bacterium]|nr:HAMP domain-containing sensor histidine kinase [Candidatus Margulisiibacteriota bacterium]
MFKKTVSLQLQIIADYQSLSKTITHLKKQQNSNVTAQSYIYFYKQLRQYLCSVGIKISCAKKDGTTSENIQNAVWFGDSHILKFSFRQGYSEQTIQDVLDFFQENVVDSILEKYHAFMSAKLKQTEIKLRRISRQSITDQEHLAKGYLTEIVNISDCFIAIDEQQQLKFHSSFRGAIYLVDKATGEWEMVDQVNLQAGKLYKKPRPARQDKKYFEDIVNNKIKPLSLTNQKKYSEIEHVFCEPGNRNNRIGLFISNRGLHPKFKKQFLYDIEEKNFKPSECTSSCFLKIDETENHQMILMLIGPTLVDPIDNFRTLKNAIFDIIDINKEFRKDEKEKNSLKIALRQAHQANEAQKHFSSIIVHDLRSPSMVVGGFIQQVRAVIDKTLLPYFEALMENDANIPKLIEKIKMISYKLGIGISEIKNMELMINTIMEFREIESRNFTIKKEKISMVDIAHKAISSFQAVLLNSQVELKANINPDDVPLINGDAHALTRVLTNLISNALKFTKEGSITVTMKTENDMLKINIIDTGIGMNQMVQEKLFGKFQKHSEAVGIQVKGTGLGLYICKSFVEKHGGSISAFSEGAGKGSTFSVLLPIDGDENIP